MPGLFDLLPLVQPVIQRAPDAIRLALLARRAAEGDREAIATLRQQGWKDALELWKPGAAQMGEHILQTVQEFRTGGVIEGEYREVTGQPPSRRFLDWLSRRTWGTVVILGPKGQAKTTVALRLAEVWHARRGWRCEAVNFYPTDDSPFVSRISAEKFNARLKRLSAYLNSDTEDDEAEEPWDAETLEDEDAKPPKVVNIKPIQKRIIIVDEASLVGTALGKGKGRDMLQAVMAQARHLNWLICYIAQTTRMLPVELVAGAEAVLIKKPLGDEHWSDRPNFPQIGQMWHEATEAFQGVRQQPAWEAFPDVRHWAYAIAKDLGTGRGFTGLVPFCLPGTPVAAHRPEEEEEVNGGG